MTQEEAEAVCEILKDADGGCPACARNLLRAFVARFPEFADVAMYVWVKNYGDEYDSKL